MELIEKKENQITFKAKIDETLANSIRRYLDHIPILAIDEVEIIKNDSALYDETIAHRIGLVPLKTDSTMNDKTEINLKIHPKKEGLVLSKEISGRADVVYDKIPLTLLDKDQELEVIGKARVGRGYEHAKFSPGLMFYRNIADITMNKNCLEEVKKLCPNAEIKEKGDKIIVSDDKKKEICDICEGITKEKKEKSETSLRDELIITIESFGQLDAKDMFKKSINELKKDLTDFSKKISK